MTWRRRLRPHRITLVVGLFGVAATVGMSTVIRQVFEDNGKTRLTQEAAQAAMVLSGYLDQSLQSVGAVGKVVTASNGDPAAFTAAISATSGSSDYTGTALLRVPPQGGITVLAHTGNVSIDATDPAQSALAAELAGQGGMHQLLLGHFGPFTTRGLVIGAPYVPSGYAIYTESLVMPPFDLSTIGRMPFSDVGIGVYLGSEDADHAWIQTLTPVARSGLRAVVTIPSGSEYFVSANLIHGQLDKRYDGKLYLVASPAGSLISPTSMHVLEVMVAIGVLSTLLSTCLLELACRRRDRAVALVAELTDKNAALDLALTRQAEAEESLRHAQRLEAVGQLAGGIAHDFNNLLAVILTYAGFVADALPSDSPAREDLDEMTKSARRGAELTRQLLLFSRRDVAQPVAVDVNESVHEVSRMLRRTLGEDIALTTDLGPSPLVVRIGAGELDQAMMNLAVNSRDAMPEGGDLAIRTRRTDSGDVEITITDTGVGMTPDQVSRACEPFYTTKEPGRGTGLGLSSVYGVVTRWEGTLDITSTKGVGTVVRIVLPSCDEAAGALALPPTRALARPGTTVLLVEDEPAVLAGTRRLLEAAGYTVLTATDGPEAITMFDGCTVDVIVTDVVMPGGLSGPQLVAGLRALRPGLPAVYMSGYPRDLITDRGILDTEDPLVEKPIHETTLLDAISRALTAVEASV